MFASMNYEKLLKNPRDSFLIAEGYTLSPSTLLSHLFVLELALSCCTESLSKRDHWFVVKKRGWY